MADRSNGVRAAQPEIPRWVRAIVRVDALARRALALESALRDELLWAWTDADARARITAAIMATQTTYATGGRLYEEGLFAWESAALRSPMFDGDGPWLLGGAGGGRELRALRAMGRRVTAFEPCARLAEAAAESVRGDDGAEVIQASYDDLVRAVRAGGGPLARVRETPWAAVILGWGSLAHVEPIARRTELFAAIAELAPRAPVLVSYLPPSESGDGVRAAARRAVVLASKSFGAPGDWGEGHGFIPTAGFVLRMSERELRASAEAAGHEVLWSRDEPYPHAVLRAFGRQ